jgi:hypothetical protein
MKHKKATGPDGLSLEFYHHFWPLICDELMSLFHAFYVGKIDLSGFRHGIFTLLHKCADSTKI